METENIDALVETFSPEVKDAFLTLLRSDSPPLFVWNGTEVSILLCEYGIRRTLYLHDAEGSLGDWESGDPLFWYVSLRQEGERYCLYGEWDETEVPFSIIFSGADVTFQPTDCTDQEIHFDAPWNLLFNAAWAVANKSKMPGAFLNAEEQALLPLANEITNLFLPAQQESFPLLKGLATSHGLSRIEKLLAKAETTKRKRAEKCTKRVRSLLCENACEPLWRELFDRFRASQAGYPREAEVNCPTDELSRTRAQVQTLMESHGYDGTYPDFTKTDEKKRTVYRVHYIETVPEAGLLNLQYVSGSVKTDEGTQDFYSCLFRGKGRRYRAGSMFILLEGAEDSLAQRVTIAVKQAEKRRLTKKEVRLTGGLPHRWAWLLLYISLFGAFIIAVVFSLFTIIGLVIGTILGQKAVFSEIEPVWWSLPPVAWALCSLSIWLYLLWRSKR